MIADNPRQRRQMEGIEKVTMRELPDFEDSLAFFNLNFGAVCPLNIEVAILNLVQYI